jgi:hypothetical protein
MLSRVHEALEFVPASEYTYYVRATDELATWEKEWAWIKSVNASLLEAHQRAVEEREESNTARRGLKDALLAARDAITSPTGPNGPGEDVYSTAMMVDALRKIDAVL